MKRLLGLIAIALLMSCASTGETVKSEEVLKQDLKNKFCKCVDDRGRCRRPCVIREEDNK